MVSTHQLGFEGRGLSYLWLFAVVPIQESSLERLKVCMLVLSWYAHIAVFYDPNSILQGLLSFMVKTVQM